MRTEMLHLSGVRHIFPAADGRKGLPVLTVPELRVTEGEFLAVIGPSGGGKSTLINLLAGFFPPTAGIILKQGKPIAGPGSDRVVVFQDHAVFPWYTALENAAYGLRGRGIGRREAEARAYEALHLVGLADCARLYPATMSGGMRQRVALARALALQPDVLLLDEPFASLDVVTRARLQEELAHLCGQCICTVVLVTHSPTEAVYLADRVALLHPAPRGLEQFFAVDVSRPRCREDPVLRKLAAALVLALRDDSSRSECVLGPDTHVNFYSQFLFYRRMSMSPVFLSTLLGVIWTALLVLPVCAATECRLAYTAKVHYAPQILALKKGWFAAPGVSVKGIDLGMSAGIAAAEALVSGSADAAVMGDVPAVFALASHRPCVLVASYGGGETMHSIIASAASGITAAKDLAGKRLGVHFGSSTHGAVYRYLQVNGLKPSTLTLVNIPQSSLVEALISGDIDALAASEPTPSLALDKVPGSYLSATLNGLNNQYPLMLVASREFADRHPEALKALIAGTRKAVHYINTEPDMAGRELSRSTGTPEKLEQSTLRKLTWSVGLNNDILASLEQTAAFLYEIGRLKSVPDIQSMARPDLLQ